MTTAMQAGPSLSGLPDYMRSYFMTPDMGNAPWRLGDWLVSTNGWAAVAVASPRGELADTLPKKLQTINDWLLHGELANPSPCRFAALVERAGAVPVAQAVSCDGCGGSGRSDHEETTCEHCRRVTRVACDRCAGDGVLAPELPQQPVLVCGVVLDMTVLSYPLACVTPRESVLIGPIKGHEDKMVGIFSEDWRIAVAGMGARFKSGAPTWEVVNP